MKKSLVVIVIILLVMSASTNLAAESFVTAQSAILIDVETGEVLYSKNMNQLRPPASTTKIMTGILAVENGSLREQVAATIRAAHEGGSSIYLSAGEILTLEELIYGLLIKSGNDAAVAIAEHIGGSVENFAEMMNLKAKQIGAGNTNFKNPNGLPQEGHLTTAYDLAQIARYALNNDFFAEVVATPRKRISWPGHNWDRILKNTNKLLTRADFVDGVKTGYTKAAGRCLVASATKGERKVISVVLKSNQLWQDSLNLLNYGFEQFEKVELIEQGKVIDQIKIRNKKIDVKTAESFYKIIPCEQEVKLNQKIEYKTKLKLPILPGENVGDLLIYNQDNKLLRKVPLIADQRVDLAKGSQFWQKVISKIQIYF
ncbi:MAG: D-alanyl-D-alanine carboxypeptidase family protein [Bacillota bacterium]